MEGLMTVAARFRDGSVRAGRVVPSTVPPHLRCVRLAEGNENVVRAFLGGVRGCPVEPSPSGLLAVDFLTRTIWQVSAFSALDSQIVAQVAWSFQRGFNSMETSSAEEMARAGRVRMAFRGREAGTQRAFFRIARTPLAHGEFRSVVEDLSCTRMRADTNGETACFAFDFSPMVLRTAPLTEQGVAATRQALSSAGFDVSGHGWSSALEAA